MQSKFTDRSTSNDDFDARVSNFLEDLNEGQKKRFVSEAEEEDVGNFLPFPYVSPRQR